MPQHKRNIHFNMDIILKMKELDNKQKVGQIKINRIIPKSYLRELSLTPYVVIVSQAKKASSIMGVLRQLQKEMNGKDAQKIQNKNQQIQQAQQMLNDQNPLIKQKQKQQCQESSQKMFLKRVRSIAGGLVQVVICKQNSPQQQMIMQKLTNLGFTEKKILQLPSQAPVTKQQFQAWSKIWPINFFMQQIARQIPHTLMSLNLLKAIKSKSQTDQHSIYLMDSEIANILLSQVGDCSGFSIDHAVMKLLSGWPQSQAHLKSPQKYYYLTGLKLYTKYQLCGMCSMALVHSRLKSLYMPFSPTQVMDSIMGCRKLNHQIIMFKLQ